MNLEEILMDSCRPFEISSTSKIVMKEASMLRGRADCLQMMAEKEPDILKVIEYTAEVAVISRLIETLEEISKETVEEAERLGMTE